MTAADCVCGSGKTFAACCARYLDGNEIAPTAEALMRSRYSAYVLGREDYLLASWHQSTRPTSLNLNAEAQTTWLGLAVKRHDVDPAEPANPDKAIVEFVARFKTGGARAERLHEVSRFVRAEDRWFYLDGKISATGMAQIRAAAEKKVAERKS